MNHFIAYEPQWTGFPKATNPPFKFLTQFRKEKGIKTSHIADYWGYTNLSKAGRRIIQFEENAHAWEPEAIERYLTYLGITRENWNQALREYQHSLPFIYRETDYTMKLIIQHFRFLQEQTDLVLHNHQFSRIPLHEVRTGLAYCGGQSFTLGTLLHLWKQGDFQTPTHLLIRGGGSPLSGANCFFGVQKEYPHLFEKLENIGYQTSSGERRTLGSWIGPILSKLKEQKKQPSSWSLSQFLAECSPDISPCILLCEGTPIGQYDYKTKTLFLSDDSPFGAYQKNCAALLPSPDEIVEIQLQEQYSDWKIWKQNIQYRSDVVIHWKEDLPFAVAQQLTQQLAQSL